MDTGVCTNVADVRCHTVIVTVREYMLRLDANGVWCSPIACGTSTYSILPEFEPDSEHLMLMASQHHLDVLKYVLRIVVAGVHGDPITLIQFCLYTYHLMCSTYA